MNKEPCPACDGMSWYELPIVGRKAMLSDGRTVMRPLHKVACANCHLVRHAAPVGAKELAAIFSQDYTLYAHAPGGRFESRRQRRYAEWIVRMTNDLTIETVLEVGAGNGSLLLELQRLRPSWRLTGIEPAPAAAAAARGAGANVRTGFLAEATSTNGHVDLVIAVNVLEHVHDPISFLRAVATYLKPVGRALIICPSADKVSTELLIFDHVHSFPAVALTRLAGKAALAVQTHALAPVTLGDFQAVILTANSSVGSTQPAVRARLLDERLTYLSGWRGIDAHLAAIAPNSEIVGFGIGEVADLLSVYAPRVWSRIRLLTIDGGRGSHKGLPVTDYAQLPPRPPSNILLAVQPSLQASLAARIREDGHRAIRWDDAVSIEPMASRNRGETSIMSKEHP